MSGADVAPEFLRRPGAPLRSEALLGRHQGAAVMGVQPVGVGPVLVDTTPWICPVVVHLAAQQMAADAPHVLVFAEAVEIPVANEDVVDVLHLEREMIEA